ncbi:hypothetical protein ApDm4_0470 [Acetobacter pomorum]|nr:hypothetical protein ApDm4_0470 [Acetobacter pomorum]
MGFLWATHKVAQNSLADFFNGSVLFICQHKKSDTPLCKYFQRGHSALVDHSIFLNF